MRRALAILGIVCALPIALPASEFDWIVREFSREIGVNPTKIPFFGLARFMVAVARPAGASDLHLAIFEHPDIAPDLFSTFADEAVVADGWRPVVRVRERNGETSNVYARQDDRKHLRLLIATLDRDDATVVEVRIQPQELIKFIDEHDRNARNH